MNIASRQELCNLFVGEGAELGVAAGNFSKTILTRSRCTLLWSIDRWSDHHGPSEAVSTCLQLVVRGKGRCVPLRMSFDEALPSFADGSLSFVYIDGYAHTGQDRGRTLEQWWPKVKVGGIFSGHDYHPTWRPTMDAVDAFVKKHGLKLNLTGESSPGLYPSWWVRKETA